MEMNEQILESIKAMVESAEEPIFSEADYALFKKGGLSEDEIKNLEKVEMLANVADVLPKDEEGRQKLSAVIQFLSQGDKQTNLANMKKLAEKDPQVMLQLMALSTIAEEENK